MRNRGLGRVYQRGHIWWIQYCFRGKVHRESSGSARRSDAVHLLGRRLGEMGRGRLIGPSVERTTFEDLAKILLDDYRANERKSLHRAETSIKALRSYFGDFLSHDIALDQLNAYVAARKAIGRKLATIKNELAALRRAFRLAEKSGKAIPPLFPEIRVNNVRSGFFERAEFQAVAARLPDDLRPIAQFAYLTGWRESEIRTLQWRQVDFGANAVRLDPGTTKNDEGRVFPFAALPQLETILRLQRARTDALQRETGRIIPSVFHRRGEPIKCFRRAWKTACEQAGFPNRLMHDFRRTAVRNLERAGVSRSVAMKITGHKTESVYRRYAIVSESDLSEGVRKLAVLLAAEQRESAKVEPLRGRIDTELAQSGHSAQVEVASDAR